MNTDDPHPLPSHVRWLGVLLKSIADRLAQALDPARLAQCSQEAWWRRDDLESRAQWQVRQLVRCAEQAGVTVTQLNQRVLTVARCDDSTVFSTLQPLRRELDTLVAHFHDLHRLEGLVHDEGERRLMIRMTRSVLKDFQAGMADMAEQIADPLAAVRRRGLPISGDVTLRLNLTLCRPAGLRRLGFWLRQVARQREAAKRTRRRGDASSSPGLWGMALGWMLGHFGS